MKIKLPQKATRLIAKFKKHGFECYLVGGFLRDQLLDRPTPAKALDFTTNATPEEMLEIFKEAKYENKFGTVLIPNEDQDYFEVTTYRTEKEYSDARHPDTVKWGNSLFEDLTRRDFTINAFATNGETLIDRFGGINDLEKKLIRAIGNPEQRFREDALRLLRAVRFASQLGFLIEPKTLQSIKELSGQLEKISAERIRDEFLKILASDEPAGGVLLLKETGLLNTILPELLAAFKIGQLSPERHHIYDVGMHLIYTLKNCRNNDPIVRLACLLHDIGKIKTRKVNEKGVVTFYNHEIVGTEMVYEIGNRLKLSRKQLHKLTKLVRFHQFSVTEEQTDSAVRRFIRNIGTEYLEDIVDLRTADRIGSGARPSSWRTELFLKRLHEVQEKTFSLNDLKVDGHDVMKILKLKPGRKVGEILQELFEKVNQEKLANNRSQLLQELKKVKV